MNACRWCRSVARNVCTWLYIPTTTRSAMDRYGVASSTSCNHSAVRRCIPEHGCGKPNVLLLGGAGVVRDTANNEPLWGNSSVWPLGSNAPLGRATAPVVATFRISLCPQMWSGFTLPPIHAELGQLFKLAADYFQSEIPCTRCCSFCRICLLLILILIFDEYQ